MFCGVASYLLWGFVALYFKAVASVPPTEVLVHRIVWSILLLVPVLAWQRGWGRARTALVEPRTRYTLLATTLLIGANWYLFIWAVTNHYVIEASMGYFINPLVNILLGFVFLRERLRGAQTVSVALALAGVIVLTTVRGLPLVALALALSFGFYGLLRKVARVDAVVGLTIETALLTPVAAGFLGYWLATGASHFGAASRGLDTLLICAGLVTAVPLLLFAAAATRLRLTTIGFLQYIAPSIQFLIGLGFGERVTPIQWVSFALIWAGLVVYSVDALRLARENRP